MDFDPIKKDIIYSLRPLNPEKVILFGSYAYGEPGEHSDVDLYIVTRDDSMPKSYEENMKCYKNYSRALKHLKEKIPFDIIVHTRQMNKVFEESGGSLAEEIKNKGIRLI